MISSLDSPTFTKPTGAPDNQRRMYLSFLDHLIKGGLRLLAHCRWQNHFTFQQGPPLHANGRPGYPRSLASCATSSTSANGRLFRPFPQVFLLIPDAAIRVSVTIDAPRFKASVQVWHYFPKNTSYLHSPKSADVWIQRFYNGKLWFRPVLWPNSLVIISILLVSMSIGFTICIFI